ncbi:unnamed protein product, partial [Arabidopsis halleri]
RDLILLLLLLLSFYTKRKFLLSIKALRLITDVLSISREKIFKQSSSVFCSCLPNVTRSKISPPKHFHRRILSTATKDITRRRRMRGRRW